MIFGLSIRSNAAVHAKGRLSEALVVEKLGLSLLLAHPPYGQVWGWYFLEAV